MARPQTHAVHPFALLLDPATVLARIERSERLQALQRHVCRPLDTLRPGQIAEDESGGRWAPPEPDEADAAEAGLHPSLRS